MPRDSDPNRCRASEIEPFVPLAAQRERRGPPAPQTAVESPPAHRIRRAVPDSPDEGGGEESRLFHDDSKLQIFKKYHQWVISGKGRNESPIDELVTEYGCHRTYPKRIYDKVLDKGGTGNNWHVDGRPSDFPPACWEEMVKLIRDARAKQQRASSTKIVSSMKKTRGKKGKKVPSKRSVQEAKKDLGFKKIIVKKKPKLSTKLWEQRLAMAKARVEKDDEVYIEVNARRIMADEKWLSEEKVTNRSVEARDDSPVPATIRFIQKDHETKTQQIKIMFLLCVTSTTPIGIYELDFKKWNKEKQQKTKGGKDAIGITADFMRPVLKKVAKDARKKLGPGPISFLHDKASCYEALAKDGTLEGVFDEVEVAAGKAPDMSHLDAGVCPFIERAVEAEGAETPDEIRAAAKKAWKQVSTPEMCQKIAKRVRKNMKEVIRLKGGNFYDE